MTSEKEFIELLKKHTDYNLDYWDPDKFNWKEYGWVLCEYCSEHFNIWWDPDKFDWKESSWALCQYCSEYFDKWWDPDKYNWKLYGDNLYKHCSDYVDMWMYSFIKYNPNDHISIILQKLSPEILQNIQVQLLLEE